jgi:uncharacterized membrane protein YccC
MEMNLKADPGIKEQTPSRPHIGTRIALRNMVAATREMNVSEMNLAAGIRASLALIVPATISLITYSPFGGFAALGGFYTAIADTGGLYRSRALVMGTVAILGSAMLVIGTFAGVHPASALALTILLAFGCAYMQAFGPAGRTVGNQIFVLFLCGVGTPYVGWVGLQRGAMCLGGGAWAMLLTLFMWPIHPYRPARRVMASCYRGLSRWVEDSDYLFGNRAGSSKRWEALAQPHQRRLAAKLEQSRRMLSDNRLRLRTDNARADQILVLTEISEFITEKITALTCLLEMLSRSKLSVESRIEISSLLARLSELFHYIAEQTGAERRLLVPVRTFQQMSTSLSLLEPESKAVAALHNFDLLMRDLLTDLRLAASVAYGVHTGQPSDIVALPQAGSLLSRGWDVLREQWSVDSIVLRHALRSAIVCGLALLVSLLFGLNHGYWAPLTAAMIIQPHSGLTLRKSVQRVVGTIAGGLIAVLLSVTLPNWEIMIAVLLPLTMITAAVRQASYGLYVLFMTPCFLLLAETHLGNWHLAQVRILDTFVGAGLAVLGAWFLWPVWERARYRKTFAAAVAAQAQYLEALLKSWEAGGHEGGRELAQARLQASTASANAEGSLQSLIEEVNDRSVINPSLSIVTSSRRFAFRLTAFSPLVRGRAELFVPLTAYGQSLVIRLKNVAEALESGCQLSSVLLHDRMIEHYSEQWIIDYMGTLERLVRMMEEASRRLNHHVGESPAT